MTILPAHDMPDDYDWLPGSARFPMADMGELAVRLGSPVTFDRRGDVLWLDTIAGGLGSWTAVTGGLGSTVNVTTNYPLHGKYTLALVAGSTLDHTAQIRKRLSNIAMLRSGLEVAFWLNTPGESFILFLTRFDGINQVGANISVWSGPKTLEYRDPAGAYHTIAHIGSIDNNEGVYHHLKVVADFTLGQYVRVIWDDHEYDLSGIPLWQVPALDIKQYRVLIAQYGVLASNDIAYIGHVIITGNEP